MACPSEERRSNESTMLGLLTPGERGQVLDALVAERPELAVEAESLAAALLSSASIGEVADEVERALLGIPPEALGARTVVPGPWIRGRGRTRLQRWRPGPSRACTEYGSRRRLTVLAYAGEDTLSEFADGVLQLAAKLGVEVPPGAPDDQWPDWTDLL